MRTVSGMERTVSTEGGLVLRVRPLLPSDREDYAAAFDRWSADSRYTRFLSPRGSLSEGELDYMTDVDQHDHVALVAFTEDGQPVGLGRFVRIASEPSCAEAAIAVADDWQGRGIGTAIGHELARRAREVGVSCFTAAALATNRPIMSLLSELGATTTQRPDGGVVEIRVDLTRGCERGTPMHAALRGAATGDLQPEPGST